jgi:glutamate N-acetyltransferase/amino-acid N-acetyltransferase
LKSAPHVPGFLAGGVASGIKKSGARDLALISCPRGATAAGVYTTNQVKSPAVLISRERVRRGGARAILANSGCANTYTGAGGMADARELAARAARALGAPESSVLVSSTGVIGARLPMPRIRAAIPRLVARLDARGWPDAAAAILTTDKRPKLAARSIGLPEGDIRILGIAKGSGMVEPRMATMLVFLATNAAVSAPLLRRLLRQSVESTFNAITIDGCMSTSDTVEILASGEGCRAPLSPGSRSARRFGSALGEVCAELARALVADGEGVGKVVRIRVRGARSTRDARLAAYAVANSMLVKTAFRGEDPNWGRIVQALGAGPARIAPDRLGIAFGKAVIVRRGRYTGAAAEEAARRVMRKPEFGITLDLGLGAGEAEVLTGDLSEAYVRINADYRS